MARVAQIFSRSYHWLGVLLIIIICHVLALAASLNSNPEDNHSRNFWSFAANWEHQFFDLRLQSHLARQQVTKSPHVVLAAIDERSITHIGRFPWTRSVWAQLLDRLSALGAKVVAFDIIFSEVEVACKADPDQQFAQAIRRFHLGPDHIIVGYAKTRNPSAAPEEFPPVLYQYLLNTQQAGSASFWPSLVGRSTFPIAPLVQTDLGMGFIDMRDDGDGVFRHYTTVANILDVSDLRQEGVSQILPSFGLLAYMRYQGDQVSVNIAPDGQGAHLITQQGVVELDAHGASKLRYRGGREAFHEISIWDILQAPVGDPTMDQLIRGKAVFVASTAFAAHDFRNSPVGSQLPGVFFHINLLDMLSEGRFFRPRQESDWVGLALMLLGSLLLLWIQRLKNALADATLLLSLIATVYLLDVHMLLPLGYQSHLFFCLLCFIALYLWSTAINFYRASQERSQIRGAFSRYVSPGIVNEILAHPEQLKIGGEKKEITVFFSDIRDFTSIAEKLPATLLADYLNQYMNRMTHILFQFKGTLDKYIGDAIVGYWGAPIPIPDHPYLATRAALEMIEALPQINQKFERQGYPKLRVGIGINTGECSVGNMGSDQIFSYTALGDSMNLGARLEGLCKFYGAQIIISQFSFERLSEEQRASMTFRQLGTVRVKGKEQAVTIYEVIHAQHPWHGDASSLDTWHRAYQLFQERQFASGEKLAQTLVDKFPTDRASGLLLEHCQSLQQNPPPDDWDATLTMESK